MAKDIRYQTNIQDNGQDIRQNKSFKTQQEHDIQYNGQRYKTNKSPKTQQRVRHTIQ